MVSINLHRRHLNVSQLVMIAARLANQEYGGDRKSQKIKVEISTLKTTAAEAGEIRSALRI